MTTKYLSGAHVTEGEMARRPSDWLGSAWSRLATWLDTCVDHWAAAEMYQQLSVLSDAELARRGLSRATLARDVLAANHAAPRRADAELQRPVPTRRCLARDATDAKRRWRRSIA